MKKFLALMLLMFSMPVFANEFDKAYSSGKDVLVYFYSPRCISCEKFNSVYFDIKKKYSDIECVRINVDTQNGQKMFRKYHGLYIPYLILTGSKSKKTVSVSLSCAINEICFERVLKGSKN